MGAVDCRKPLGGEPQRSTKPLRHILRKLGVGDESRPGDRLLRTFNHESPVEAPENEVIPITSRNKHYPPH